MTAEIKKRSIEITIQPEFKPYVKSSWLRSIIQHTLQQTNPTGSCSISLAITNDDTIRSLNQQFRNFDEVTDVLAFGNHGEFEDETVDSSLEAVEFPNPEDLLSHLGEVVLSYPQAQRQALENTVSIDSEIALLVIHGILHLLGYEHHTNDQEILMTDSQSKILRSFLENAKSANHGK
ncbi:MAG: rRNA maturation RNase YbeY [Dehalococcoidia bacterium]|nr:rRNA maturation RNase YbeY [Dehalococcoidia bacterium]